MEYWSLREWHADYLEACNRHDLEAVRGFLDPAVRRAHLPGGDEAWLQDLAELFHGFPDWRWRGVQLIADEDRVAVHLRGSGTHRGPYGGLVPTRRHVNVAEFAMYRVRHGRITESSGLTDRLDLLTQLGHSVP